MEIKQKGESASFEGFNEMRVTLSWSAERDIDLAALWELKNGEKGLCYFNELGTLDRAPFMKLSGDQGVGNTAAAGGNKEIMTIAKLSDTKLIHLIAWDWTSVQKGEPAQFDGVKINLTDGSTVIDAPLDAGDVGNTVIVATVDNSGLTPKLTNQSKVGTLKGLKDSSQLWTIANQ